MHSYTVRPGYGSDKLLIEFGPDFGNAQFSADLKSLFAQHDLSPVKRGHYVLGAFKIYSSPAGPFELDDDGQVVFIHAERNQAAIHYLDQIFQKSGLFVKQEVDYTAYAQRTASPNGGPRWWLAVRALWKGRHR